MAFALIWIGFGFAYFWLICLSSPKCLHLSQISQLPPTSPNGKNEIYSTHARTLLAPPISSIFALALHVAATVRRPNLRRRFSHNGLPILPTLPRLLLVTKSVALATSPPPPPPSTLPCRRMDGFLAPPLPPSQQSGVHGALHSPPSVGIVGLTLLRRADEL